MGTPRNLYRELRGKYWLVTGITSTGGNRQIITNMANTIYLL